MIPTRWTEETIGGFLPSGDFTQDLQHLTIKCGWYDRAAAGQDALLIEQERILVDLTGKVTRRDVEEWTYEQSGCPPTAYKRTTSGCVDLPGYPGDNEPWLEEERIQYWPWLNFLPGVNLSRRRVLAAMVVYDQKTETVTLDAAAQAKLRQQGMSVPDPPTTQQVITSARLWSEAVRGNEIVHETGARQWTKRVDPAQTEVELVVDEVDKRTSYVVRINHIRPGDSTSEGPTHQQKEGYVYQLPVPIDPPRVIATAVSDAIKVHIEAGGATIPAAWGDSVVLRPDSYILERKTVSGGDRTATTDPLGMYDEPPPSTPANSLWTDGAVTDLTGTPAASDLPAQTGYSEPGDPSAPIDEGWAVIAEPLNAVSKLYPGQADVLDRDVVNGAVYRYRARAVIGEEQSEPSLEVEVIYGGETGNAGFLARSRLAADGSLEVDVLTPVDPGLGEDYYGECGIYDLPLDGGAYFDGTDYTEIEDLATGLAQGIAARSRAAKLQATVEVGMPLLPIRRGQSIQLGSVQWSIIGNSLIIDSETAPDLWLLDGYRLGAHRNGDRVEGLITTLELLEP